MKIQTSTASPRVPSKLELEILQCFKPAVAAKKPKSRRADEASTEPPTKPRTDTEIAIEQAREGWIRAHNARLRTAREALQKKISIARGARLVRGVPETTD